MTQIKCANCGLLNAPNMNFCTGCGKKIVLVTQSEVQTVEKFAIATDKNQSTTKASKSGSKMWLFGLFGCFGLVFLVAIGAVLLSMYSLSTVGETSSNTNKNANNKKVDPVSLTNSKSNSNTEISDETDLIEILNEHKEAGKFKQLTAKVVKTDEFYYYANAAAQSTYHNGSQYVSLTIGRFENFDDAKKNFDEQFANVKKKGGKTQILETSADGTINGVYQVKDIFTAEYCTKSAFCYRMVSKDAKSLKYFIENFVRL
jgi:hypothetical protein